MYITKLHYRKMLSLMFKLKKIQSQEDFFFLAVLRNSKPAEYRISSINKYIKTNT